MKSYIFWLGAGVYTTYKGETLGQAINNFVKDGLHDICRVTSIEEAGAAAPERVTS